VVKDENLCKLQKVLNQLGGVIDRSTVFSSSGIKHFLRMQKHCEIHEDCEIS
jgi:hypothetical protein